VQAPTPDTATCALGKLSAPAPERSELGLQRENNPNATMISGIYEEAGFMKTTRQKKEYRQQPPSISRSSLNIITQELSRLQQHLQNSSQHATPPPQETLTLKNAPLEL
jgi:hypothetical protein